MAKTDAERARDYRARQREKRGIVPMMPVAEYEAFKAKARQLAEQQRARIAALEQQLELREQILALRGELAELEGKLDGGRQQTGPNCQHCGTPLGCPRCYRDDDF